MGCYVGIRWLHEYNSILTFNSVEIYQSLFINFLLLPEREVNLLYYANIFIEHLEITDNVISSNFNIDTFLFTCSEKRKNLLPVANGNK